MSQNWLGEYSQTNSILFFWENIEMFEIYFFHYIFLLRGQEGVILNKIRNSQQNWCAENSEKNQLIIQISKPIYSWETNNSFNEGEKMNRINFQFGRVENSVNNLEVF
jgi:hypothetical protein